MDKIEVSQRARDFAADYLDKNGQIAGNSAENIKAGLWDETRHIMDVARFERDILATRTDATPVATDVAALVEAAKASAEGWANAVEFNLLPVQHWQTANDLQRQLRQALVPFTEGQP